MVKEFVSLHSDERVGDVWLIYYPEEPIIFTNYILPLNGIF